MEVSISLAVNCFKMDVFLVKPHQTKQTRSEDKRLYSQIRPGSVAEIFINIDMSLRTL